MSKKYYRIYEFKLKTDYNFQNDNVYELKIVILTNPKILVYI